jgi:hypothetical protein
MTARASNSHDERPGGDSVVVGYGQSEALAAGASLAHWAA